MNDRITVKPDTILLRNLLNDAESSKYKAPRFQRDFLWDKKDINNLFDSIKKQYPIGTIIFWRSDLKYQLKEEIGGYYMNYEDNSSSLYILDGFQRISSIFGCLINPHKTKLERTNLYDKKLAIFYNIERDEFTNTNNPKFYDMPLYKLMDTFALINYQSDLKQQMGNSSEYESIIERINNTSVVFLDYRLPYIELSGGGIEEAVEIFSRVNSKGIVISPDYMLSALLSRKDSPFNLAEEFTLLKENLQIYNFSDIKREVLLQCVQTCFGRIYFDQKPEYLLGQSDFIIKFEKIILSIERAVKFLYEELLVLNRKLLPYNNQLIFLTYYFYKHEIITEKALKDLKTWFWQTTYSNYFTIYSLSKIREAFNHFVKYTEGSESDPFYKVNQEEEFYLAELPSAISAKSVRSTANLLFLINYSNDFKSVKAKEIESIEYRNLFPGKNLHEFVVTIIRHIDPSMDIIDNKKERDWNIFNHGNFEKFSDKLLLSACKELGKALGNNLKELNSDMKNSIQSKRKNEITKAEKDFITQIYPGLRIQD